jgi:hypothetical protein
MRTRGNDPSTDAVGCAMTSATCRVVTVAFAAAAVLLAASAPAVAQKAWPERPVRLVVAFGAGGSSDTVARTVAQVNSPALQALSERKAPLTLARQDPAN